MLFNSYDFLFVFLPLTFSVYFTLAKFTNHKTSKGFLVIASMLFYAQWNAAYVLLISLSIVVNFVLGNRLLTGQSSNKESNRRLLLILGITFNLSLLGYFKYLNFLVDNLNYVTGKQILIPEIILPLAISFFTFQQIAFLTERYKGVEDKYSFLDYSLFVVFFPQLIAGPIVQPKDTLSQFSHPKAKFINPENIFLGLALFSIGIFKKVVIADSFVLTVSTGFSGDVISSIEAWTTALSYTFQLYFDFSGYTDMALGLGLLFNIKLPRNFNSPYKAVNIQDFWRRWHITLSSFLRDYLYIPLGGNRKGMPRAYANLFITFLLGGLWHGAGWTFIVWGAIHGAALCIHRAWSSTKITMPSSIAWLITMLTVITAWVFFRAPNLDIAINIVKAMFNVKELLIYFLSLNLTDLISVLSFDAQSKIVWQLLACILICLTFKNSNNFIKSAQTIKTYQIVTLSFMLATGVLLISLQKYTEFIYFNF